MDDFDRVYSERMDNFTVGHLQGKKQAEKMKQEHIIEQSEQFGQEFAKQLAIYQAFIEELALLQVINQDKTSSIAIKSQQLKTGIAQITYKSLKQLQKQREDLNIIFKGLLELVGIPKNSIKLYFDLAVKEESLDF